MADNTVLQVGVKILLKNKDGKFLFLHRSAKKYPDAKSRWDLVGGKIDSDTLLEEDLRREINEETGLKLIGTPRLIAAQGVLRIMGRYVIRLTYLGEASGKVALDMKESDNSGWFSLDEIGRFDDLDFYLKELLNKRVLDNLR